MPTCFAVTLKAIYWNSLFQSSVGKTSSETFFLFFDNVDRGSGSVFWKCFHQRRGQRSAFRAVHCSRALWKGHPCFFNTGKTEIQQLKSSTPSGGAKNTAASYVFGVRGAQRCLQICQYLCLPGCFCCRNRWQFCLTENHICQQMHEKWAKHSHCKSRFGGSNPHRDRHSNQRVQGELFASCCAVTARKQCSTLPRVSDWDVLCFCFSSWQKTGHLASYCASSYPTCRKHRSELLCWAYVLWALTGTDISICRPLSVFYQAGRFA